MSVRVFLQGLQTKETITYYTYKEVQLFGDLGGNMELFLGISIISIIEVLVFVFDEFKKCICPKSQKKSLKFDNKLKCIPNCEGNSPNVLNEVEEA